MSLSKEELLRKRSSKNSFSEKKKSIENEIEIEDIFNDKYHGSESETSNQKSEEDLIKKGIDEFTLFIVKNLGSENTEIFERLRRRFLNQNRHKKVREDYWRQNSKKQSIQCVDSGENSLNFYSKTPSKLIETMSNLEESLEEISNTQSERSERKAGFGMSGKKSTRTKNDPRQITKSEKPRRSTIELKSKISEKLNNVLQDIHRSIGENGFYVPIMSFYEKKTTDYQDYVKKDMEQFIFYNSDLKFEAPLISLSLILLYQYNNDTKVDFVITKKTAKSCTIKFAFSKKDSPRWVKSCLRNAIKCIGIKKDLFKKIREFKDSLPENKDANLYGDKQKPRVAFLADLKKNIQDLLTNHLKQFGNHAKKVSLHKVTKHLTQFGDPADEDSLHKGKYLVFPILIFFKFEMEKFKINDLINSQTKFDCLKKFNSRFKKKRNRDFNITIKNDDTDLFTFTLKNIFWENSRVTERKEYFKQQILSILGKDINSIFQKFSEVKKPDFTNKCDENYFLRILQSMIREKKLPKINPCLFYDPFSNSKIFELNFLKYDSI